MVLKKEKQRFIIDTNILLTGFLDSYSISAKLINSKKIQFYITENIFEECKTVIRKYCFEIKKENLLINALNGYVKNSGILILSSLLPNFIFSKQRNDEGIKSDMLHNGITDIITYNLKDFASIKRHTPEFIFGRNLRELTPMRGLKGFFGDVKFGDEWTMIHIGRFYGLEEIIHDEITKIRRNKNGYFEIINESFVMASKKKFIDGEHYSLIIEYNKTSKIVVSTASLKVTDNGIHLIKEQYLEAEVKMTNPKVDLFFNQNHHLTAKTEYFSLIPEILKNQQLKICIQSKTTDHLHYSIDVKQTIDSMINLHENYVLFPKYQCN